MVRRLGLIVLVACLVAGCGEGSTASEDSASGTSNASADRYPEGSPEWNLASIDEDTADPSDEQVQPYARALDRLERFCTNPRSRLADFAVVTVEQAAKENVKTNALNVLRGVRRSFPDDWPRRGCRDQFVMYTVVLTAR